MNAKKRCVLLLLAAALLLSGCGETARREETPEDLPPDTREATGASEYVGREPADRVFSLNWDPEAGVNPIRIGSAANLQFWSLIYDSVFVPDDDGSVTSDVVSTYTSDDHIWWVFTVNTALNYSDGTPLSAWDVAYSIQLARATEYYSGRLDIIYGCSAFDSSTFAITTKKAATELPALLNIPVIRAGSYYEDYPVGTGPYMLDAARSVLVPNPEYDRAASLPVDAVYLKDYTDVSARITAFEDASLDFVTNDPTGMYNLGYGNTSERRYCETSNMHYIGFNTRSNYFLTPAARQAVTYLIDRDYVAGTLMRACGVPAALPVHPGNALYDADYAAGFGYDPEKAMALFEAAGAGDLDGDGEPEIMVTGIVIEFHIKFIVNTDSSVKLTAARRLTEELNDLGITTTLYELSWEEYTDALLSGDFDMYYGEVRLTANWDLGFLLTPPDQTGPNINWGMNYARTTDETYTRLYDAYLAAEEDTRYDAFQAAVRYVSETAVILPICFERREILTHRGVVSGIRATQYDLFHHFTDWTIDLS